MCNLTRYKHGGLRFVVIIFSSLLTVSMVSAQSVGQDIANHLAAMQELLDQALESSQQAENASSVADLKGNTDAVFEKIWGISSTLADPDDRGAVPVRDWKTRWQTDTDDFKLETPDKFGVEPAEETDPAKLGLVGRGRYVRRLIWADSANTNMHYGHTLAALNNVIGWQRMDYAPARGGMPRVDLTYQWDAPSEFWQSTADTGWIHEVYTQAMNILKTDYGNDLDEAKRHAAGLTQLIQKNIDGEDADGNGTVEPKMMEGGLSTAIVHARLAGFNVPN